MLEKFDVIVLGLGAMGSAAAYHLARRGCHVLGLDRYRPPHTLGSSHGASRIIRSAYFEDPRYVPLVLRASELWDELEHESGETLRARIGCLSLGSAESALVNGARLSAVTHRIPHEMLDIHQLRRRFPALNPPDDTVGLWESGAGVLFPERCISAHLACAKLIGAELRFDEPASNWVRDGAGIRVRTSKGEYLAERLVLSLGAWTRDLLAALDLRLPLELTVERQVICWFAPRAHPEYFDAKHHPPYVWENEPGHYIYGFPDLGEGVKFARHHDGERVDPGTVRRTASSDELEEIGRLAQHYFPDLADRPHSSSICLYTNTPDYHFLIDKHPQFPQAFVASPCSGHGFKFASAIGECLADWIVDGHPGFDLNLFSLNERAVALP